MKFLFDISHPAHVHLFRQFMHYLKKETEHEIFVTARDKDITIDLLDHYQIDYYLTRPFGGGLLNNMAELVYRDHCLIQLHRKHRFDIAIGTSANLGHLSLFGRVKSFNFITDDDVVVTQLAFVDYPFVTKIVNPDCVRFKSWPKKRILHPSYHELAFLHPNRFTPDPSVLEKYNLKPHEYIVVRRSARQAYHDKTSVGLPMIWQQVEAMIRDYPLVVSTENSKTHQIDPWDMFDILAHAYMLVSDSGAMTAEAGVLGVPAFMYSYFSDKLGYVFEMEHKYHLVHGFFPGKEDEKLLNTLGAFLRQSTEEVRETWQYRRRNMLADKVDFTQWMIDYFFRQREING